MRDHVALALWEEGGLLFALLSYRLRRISVSVSSTNRAPFASAPRFRIDDTAKATGRLGRAQPRAVGGKLPTQNSNLVHLIRSAGPRTSKTDTRTYLLTSGDAPRTKASSAPRGVAVASRMTLTLATHGPLVGGKRHNIASIAEANTSAKRPAGCCVDGASTCAADS